MRTKQLPIVMAAALLAGVLGGCGPETATLANTQVIDAAGVTAIRLDYDADDIHLMKSPDEDIALKEYMSRDKKRYYAKVESSDGELRITEGQRPVNAGFVSYVELYLPEGYAGGLALHSTSGRVDSAIALRLDGGFAADTTSGAIALSGVEAADIAITTTSGGVQGQGLQADSILLKSTSGELELADVGAEAIVVDTTSAAVALRDVAGTIRYTTTSGALTVEGLAGSGSFASTGDGGTAVTLSDIRGNTDIVTKNGDIRLQVPQTLEYLLSATTREGRIETPYEQLATTPDSVNGAIGQNPQYTVRLETRGGDIVVTGE